MADVDRWRFSVRVKADTLSVRIVVPSESVHKPKETIDFEGREAREAFRLFSRGFADGEAEQREGEQRPGTFLWARLKHREGASVYSRFADASFHGLRKWEEHRFPALAFDAIDWEVVRDG